MLRLIKQVFIALLSFSGSLARIVNKSDHIKCITLNNQQFRTYILMNTLKADVTIHFQLI